MTINTSWYTMDNKLGVNLNKVITSVTITANPTQPEYPGVPMNLGDRVQGTDGSEWMLVKASATVSCFNVVAIDTNLAAANMSTALLASGVYVPGIAQFQIRNNVTVGNANGGVANAGDFFWALMKANSGIRLNTTATATLTPGAALYIDGANPGFITASAPTSAAPGGGRLNGLMYVGTVSIDGASTAAVLSVEGAMFSYILPGVLVSVRNISS